MWCRTPECRDPVLPGPRGVRRLCRRGAQGIASSKCREMPSGRPMLSEQGGLGGRAAVRDVGGASGRRWMVPCRKGSSLLDEPVRMGRAPSASSALPADYDDERWLP